MIVLFTMVCSSSLYDVPELKTARFSTHHIPTIEISQT